MQMNNLVKKLILVSGMVASFSVAQAADITGAGNGLNYQSIGSGGGIKQIKAKTVDFGASDMPLKADELAAEGLTQFPAIIGGVVPVVNLDGVAAGKMKMTGDVLAGIYMGKITKWNAPEIVAINPGIK